LLPWVSGNRGIGKFLKLGWFIYTDNSIGLLDGYIPSGKLIEKEDGLLKSIAKEIAFLPVNVEHIVEDYTIDDFRTDIIHGNNFLIPYGNITSIYEEDKGNYNLLLVNYNDKNKERVIRFGKVLSTQDMGGGPIPKSFAAMDWKPVIKAVKKFEKSIKE